MNEIVRSVRRAWQIFSKAPVVFVAAGAVWTVLVAVTAGLLVGPALVSLIALALRVHEGREVTISDAFTAFEDIGSSLAAGLIFWAPFALWGALSEGIGWVGAALTLALAVHFAYFVHAFSVIADRRSPPLRAFAEAVRLAEPREGQPAAAGGTVAGGTAAGGTAATSSHLAFGLLLFVALSLAWAVDPLGFPVLMVLAAPFTACLLTAWHAQRASPSTRSAELSQGEAGARAGEGGVRAGEGGAERRTLPRSGSESGVATSGRAASMAAASSTTGSAATGSAAETDSATNAGSAAGSGGSATTEGRATAKTASRKKAPSKAQTKTTTKAQSKTKTKAKTKTEPKAKAKTEPKAKAKTEPKASTAGTSDDASDAPDRSER